MLLGKTLNITFGACLFFLFHTTSVEKQLLMMPTSLFMWALFRKKKKGGDFLRSSFYRSRFFPFLSKSQFWEIIRTEIPLIVCQPIPEEGPTIGPKVMNMPTHYPYIAEICAIKRLGYGVVLLVRLPPPYRLMYGHLFHFFWTLLKI